MDGHPHLPAALERHRHFGPAAVQGPSRGVDAAVDPLGVRHPDDCRWVHASPFYMRAAAGYQYLVRTRMMTIRMMSTTTPIPNSLAGEPPAGPRRRSYTPTRRLGRCEDEGSGIWILLYQRSTRSGAGSARPSQNERRRGGFFSR